MSSHDLPIGDRAISEMLENPESEVGATLREVIEREVAAAKEYSTAMSIAIG